MKNSIQKGMSAVGVIITVVIIIILAAIVMAMNNDTTDINLLRNGTDTDNNTNNNGSAVTTTTGSPTELITYQLNEQNNSGQRGAVVISEENGRAKVTITLTGSSTTAAQPAHIHMNSCANIGGVVYPLNNVVNGSSVTVLDVPASQVLTSLPRSVNVHKSTAQSSVYVACADITPTSAVR